MSRPDPKKLLLVLLLAAFAVAMVWPLVFGGELYTFRDFGRFYVPVKKAYIQRLLQGELLIWLPELNCGTPIHGALVHAFLYPGNVLLLAGDSLGWGLYFAAHLFLAGLGARALARKLGAGEEGAFAAAIAYAGSGYLVCQMNHVPYATVAAWSPVIITVGLSAAEGKRWSVPLLAGAFAMAALGGEPFTLILTITFLGILVMAGQTGPRLPSLLRIGGAGLVALLLATPVLIPALDVFSQSGRADGFSDGLKGYGSIHPIRLLTLLSPECLGRYQHQYSIDQVLFGIDLKFEAHILLGLWFGAVGLLAVALAPVRRSRVSRVLLVTAGLSVLLSLGDHLGLAPLLTKVVPGLSVFRYADKYWLLVTLAVIPVIGLALPQIKRRPGLILAGIGAALAVALAYAFARPEAALTGAAPFVLAAGALLLPPALRTRALIVVLAAELLFAGLRHPLTADPARTNPRNGRIGRVLSGLDHERIFVHFKNVPVRHLSTLDHVAVLALRNLDSISGVGEGFSYTMGYDPTEPLSRTTKFFEIPKDVPDLLQTARFHRYLRLSANSHSITNVDLRNDVEVRPILEHEGGIRLYRYMDPLPRAALFGDAIFVADRDEAKERLDDFGFDPFRTLLIEGKGAPESFGPPRGSVELLVDADREVRLRVRTDRPSWVFLSDSYANGWRATVNGEPAEIRPAMIAFRAVRLTRGESIVRFRYEPSWLRIAPVTFGLGVLLLLGLAWRARRGRQREAQEDREPV